MTEKDVLRRKYFILSKKKKNEKKPRLGPYFHHMYIHEFSVLLMFPLSEFITVTS